jgi:hypothetical protein
LSHEDGNISRASININNARNASTGDWNATYFTNGSDSYLVLGADMYNSTASYQINEIELLEDGGNGASFSDITTFASQDVTKGSISDVYTLRKLTTSTITDQNITGIATATTGKLDGNTTLSGNKDDLGSQIYWADDMPTDSPIIDIAQGASKRVITMLTASTVSAGDSAASDAGDVRWLGVDTTKSPDTWYDPVNTDVQELLWTSKKLGYWVRLEPFSATTLSLNPSSSYTSVDSGDYRAANKSLGYVQTHFNNNLSSTTGVGTVANHINKSLTLLIDGLSNNDTYTVNAIISGGSYPMKRDSNNMFSLRVNDTQMGLSEPGQTDYGITIKAYDGFGNEAEFVDAFSTGFTRPTTPNVAYTTSASTVGASVGLEVSATNAVAYELHEGNISDYAMKTSNLVSSMLIPSTTLSTYADGTTTNAFKDLTGITDLGWDSISSAKKWYDLKVVAISSDGLYSDIQGIKYVPAYINSSVLKATGVGAVDATPYSYKYNRSWTGGNGVQLQVVCFKRCVPYCYFCSGGL